jgi:hypothetical protein
MNRTVGFFALASTLVALSGCGSLPSFAPAVVAAPVPATVPCLNCGAQPYYAYAVSRPPMCNDYPVTYRVQIPETDERIRAVDRSELYSRDGMVTVYGGCPR